jgi:hypothetical protein
MEKLAHIDVPVSEIRAIKKKHRELTSKKERTGRLQLALPESSFDRLEAIKEATEAASFAEVVRRALRIYEGLIAESHDGGTIVVKRKDGTEEVVPLHRGL